MSTIKKILLSSLVIFLAFGVKIYASTIPASPANFETSLVSPIGATDTSMTLVSGTLANGSSLSGYTCFTVDSGTPTLEFICGTASGTSITSLVRGVDTVDGKTSVAALEFSHRRGADVKITDFPAFSIVRNIANGTDTFPNILSYGSDPSFTTGTQIIDKTYVDNSLSGGTALLGITNDTSTNATMYPVWVTANTGNLPIKVSSTKLSFNPSTGLLSSIGFSGSTLTLGGATSSAVLTLPSGTSSAGTSPLKFTSGTLLSTPESGAVEFNGTHFYGTISGVRYQLDQQSAASGLTVGTSVITGGSSGNVFYNNGGVLGEMTTSGSGTGLALTNSPTITTPSFTNGLKIGGSATSGTILIGNGTNYVPSTNTFPNASATAGKIIKSDGTNWVASTETYPAPGSNGNIMQSDGTNWTSVVASNALSANVQTFGSSVSNGSFTWTKPTGAKSVTVYVVGGGSGGSSGSAGTDGSGGGGGAYTTKSFDASILGSTVTINVGAGGSAGSAGVVSSFGTWIKAGGGNVGAGGGSLGNAVPVATTTSGIGGQGGQANGNAEYGGGGGAGGGSGAASPTNSGGSSIYGSGGGGGGGGGQSGSSPSYAGSAGGTSGSYTNGGGGTFGAGTSGSSVGNPGTAGSTGATLGTICGAGGGGGGGGSGSFSGGAGGAGGFPGGGGGGGGDSYSGTGGAGGAGANGEVVVITYF